MSKRLKYILTLFLLMLMVTAMVTGCKKEKVKAKPKKIEKIVITDAESVAFDSTLALSAKSNRVSDFYRMYTFHTVWNTKAIRDKALEMINSCEEEGLFKKDYNYKYLSGKYPINSVSDRAKYDVAMSKAMLDYLHDLSEGKLDPTTLYGSWNFYNKPNNVPKLLANAIQKDSIFDAFEKAKPTHKNYTDLKTALAVVGKLGDEKFEKIEFTDKIVANDSGATILKIKKILTFWNDYKTDSLTDKYDKPAQTAMKSFQRRHGLAADGVIGKSTINALNFSKAERKAQIIANLERWRWFPRTFATNYIMVNIPDYRLQYIKDGDTVVEKRVVVGKVNRRTPVLTSKFSNIVLNPTWTVPPTILKEDLLPAATKSLDYFRRTDIEIFDSKMNVVLPEDWDPKRYEYYRYVQKPSYGNSLGVVKFNFPNKFMVYLHDTNHRNYFSKNFRSLSSGCVRVENPLPLAEILLDDEKKYSLEQLQEIVDLGETTIIYFKTKIYLYQLYWTASLSKSGKLQFDEDIYNLDMDLYDSLNK